jgi:hypothetical protein
VWVVLFVPHTTWLAASAGRDIEMWDAATGAKVFELPGQTSAVQSLAISTDGRTLAAGDDAGEIWLWNLERRTPRARLRGHKWQVSSLAFAPTTRAGHDVLVSASRDGSVGIWDPRTESRLLTLVALRDGNDWLAVTAEGLFDGTPDAMRKMYWRLGTSNTLAPIDAFFTEFYHPGLIGDIFEGLQPKPTRDLVSLLQTPGLRTMLLKGMARILPGRTGRRLCTDSPVTAAPSIYSDGVPYSLDLNALIKDPSDVECPNAIDLPANGQLELSALPVEARPLATEPPYDGQPSRVSQSTLHVRFFGISQYTLARNGLQPLSEGMTAFLTRLEGVFRNLAASGRSPFARVRVWDGLYDERAGRQAIRSGLEELIHAVGPDDVVLLYFAGHGLVPAGQEMFCFAPFDIAGPDPLTQMETGLTTAHLADVVRRLPARRIVLLIDACQSGGAVESLARIAEARVRAAARATRGVTPSPDAALGIYVITAATPLQRVLQSVNGMTVLSSAFSEAIGSATCQDGCTASVRDVIARIDAAYKRQNPEYSPLIQSFGVDFPLWRAAPP